MASALIGAVSCDRCAAPHEPGAVRCGTCGAAQEPPAGGSALGVDGSVLAGVARATGRWRRSATGVDLVLVALIASGVGVSALLALPVEQPRNAITAGAVLLSALAVVAVLTGSLRRTGRTPGRVAARLRTVDTLTGLPPVRPGVALAAVLLGRDATVLTADLVRGRDPQDAALGTAAVGAATEPAAPQPVPAATPTRVDAPAARLVLDSGDELVLASALLLGRDPEPRGRVRALHALPDLSRGVARTHLLAEWSDGLVWLTDLRTANGTEVVGPDGTVRPLVPGARTAVPFGATARLGGRSLTVHSVEVTGG